MQTSTLLLAGSAAAIAAYAILRPSPASSSSSGGGGAPTPAPNGKPDVPILSTSPLDQTFSAWLSADKAAAASPSSAGARGAALTARQTFEKLAGIWDPSQAPAVTPDQLSRYWQLAGAGGSSAMVAELAGKTAALLNRQAAQPAVSSGLVGQALTFSPRFAPSSSRPVLRTAISLRLERALRLLQEARGAAAAAPPPPPPSSAAHGRIDPNAPLYGRLYVLSRLSDATYQADVIGYVAPGTVFDIGPPQVLDVRVADVGSFGLQFLQMYPVRSGAARGWMPGGSFEVFA